MFELFKNGVLCDILVEAAAFEGVRLIADEHSNDVSLVCGKKPKILSTPDELSTENVVIFATLGKSPVLDRLIASSKLSADGIAGKREVFGIFTVGRPFEDRDDIKSALIVCGSDKRGTIYGIFDLSERVGVSPLVYWGDVVPKKKSEVSLAIDSFISKEPSVRYRGLFINDDWPAFGGWSKKRFGGYNAKAYDHVFKLILRLKGNYLWPAMWTGEFWDDGPGLKNAELADTYGIIVGASHHEPMCRAGAEWQHIYKKYGDDNTWSFISNKEAITEFWRDGLKRSKNFENLITIGMRGENDSLLLGKNATLEDNINVLRNVINTQNELMKEIVDPELSNIPRMLALYYEVEDFYHGDKNTKGLKNWEALDGVTLMLCDDTYGNLRFIPDETDRDHNGGFGMYYHYDYHGASISYEWMNTNRLTKTWEQMTMAYDYGIRDLWIVNLGDIKGLEYPLCYFLSLAYDFEKHGTTARNSVEGFVKDWVKQQYGDWFDENQLADVEYVLNGYTKYNNLRSPESMNEHIYAPINFREGERVHAECDRIIKTAERLYRDAPAEIKPSVFYELYYPAVASLNFVQMSIEAGLNNFYASHGSLAANKYLDCVKKRVKRDLELKDEFDSLLDSKWVHMADSAHHGFRSWNNEDWRYPLVSEVIPVDAPKSYVSFAGSEKYSIGTFWCSSPTLENREFLNPDAESIAINIETGSSAPIDFEISCDAPWLSFERKSGSLSPDTGLVSVAVSCDRSKLGKEVVCADVAVKCVFKSDKRLAPDEEMFDKPIGRTLAKLKIFAGGEYKYPAMTFVDTEGYVSVEASHYSSRHDTADAAWLEIDHLSRLDTPAMKVLPSTKAYLSKTEDRYLCDDVPYLEYSFTAQKSGKSELTLWLSNRNPVAIDASLRLGVSLNGDEIDIIRTVPKGYKPGMHGSTAWGDEVLDKIRKVKAEIEVAEGVNKLRIYGGDPNIILEKFTVCPIGAQIPESYLGAPESYYVK